MFPWSSWKMIGGEKGYKSNESIYKFDFRYNLTKI